MADLFDLLATDRLPELRDALAADPARAMIRNAAGASLLAQAVYLGKSEAVDMIRGALPGLDPHEAVMLGDAGALRGHLERGWDPDTLAPDGFPPLALAAFFGKPGIFRLLLPLTRDVNRRSENPQRVAALHAATAAHDAGMVEQLLCAGADPDLPQAHGFVALHASARNGDAAICGLLILSGASPAATSDDGRSAVDLAREGGHDWLAERLAALASGAADPSKVTAI